jgi:hypothetical protein
VAAGRLVERHEVTKEPVHTSNQKKAIVGTNNMFVIIYQILRRNISENSNCIPLTALRIPYPARFEVSTAVTLRILIF